MDGRGRSQTRGDKVRVSTMRSDMMVAWRHNHSSFLGLSTLNLKDSDGSGCATVHENIISFVW